MSLLEAPIASEVHGLPSDLVGHCTWTDEMVAACRLSVADVPFVTVGGGLASFAVVSHLRVAGVGSRDIAVLTPDRQPYATFRSRAVASQMSDDDPIRSDASSRIDNPWGFPSYAVEEAIRRRTLRPLGRVLGEPLLCQYYNPRCQDVYDGLDREAARLGWADMVGRGWVTLVRRRAGGGYFAVLALRRGGLLAFRCRYAHLGIGYPSFRLLPDVKAYRARTGDTTKAVHVYEPHEHVYDALSQRPGTVVLRGAGIAASRILERLIDDRDHHGLGTIIIHLLRPTDERSNCHRWDGDGQLAYQPFSFPKGAFGGELAARYSALTSQERARFVQTIGRTTTAWRHKWQEQLNRGRHEGWYRTEVAVPSNLRSEADRISLDVSSPDGQGRRVIDADFLLDATGLDGDAVGHRIVEDLVACGGAVLNRLGRLETEEDFEVKASRNGAGRIYASGAVTVGGPVAAVDSFFGLNQAALRICDSLAAQGFGTRIGPRQSVRAWWRHVRNRPL